MKKIILSVVAIATLTTGAFANDGVKISKESLMNNLDKMEYMYSVKPNNSCATTVETFKKILPEDAASFKNTKTTVKFLLEIIPDLEIATGFDNESLTLLTEKDGTDYYFFDNLDSCNEAIKILNK